MKKQSKVKEIEKKSPKKNKKEYINAIPVEIRVLFGKFYMFSIILSIFLGVVYQLIINKISFISRILLLVVVILFYLFMIIDLFKKKKNFMSSVVFICIMIFMLSLSLAIYRFIINI